GQETIRTGAADDDARLSVAREHHAHPPRLKVEGRCVTSARKRVPHDYHFVLPALNLVGRRHHDVVGVEAVLAQGVPDGVYLIVVSRYHRNIRRYERSSSGIAFVHKFPTALKQTLHDVRYA